MAVGCGGVVTSRAGADSIAGCGGVESPSPDQSSAANHLDILTRINN